MPIYRIHHNYSENKPCACYFKWQINEIADSSLALFLRFLFFLNRPLLNQLPFTLFTNGCVLLSRNKYGKLALNVLLLWIKPGKTWKISEPNWKFCHFDFDVKKLCWTGAALLGPKG